MTNLFNILGVATLLVQYTALVMKSEQLFNTSIIMSIVVTILGLIMIVTSWCSKENTYK